MNESSPFEFSTTFSLKKGCIGIIPIVIIFFSLPVKAEPPEQIISDASATISSFIRDVVAGKGFYQSGFQEIKEISREVTIEFLKIRIDGGHYEADEKAKACAYEILWKNTTVQSNFSEVDVST